MTRYSRQILLPEIGEKGQTAIRRARVLCVGAGGLGSPVAQYLVSAGIGRLVLADADRVDESNLQRQILFTTPDVGRLKAEVAAERLRAMNPECEVIPIAEKVHAETEAGAQRLTKLVQDCDILIDATDNFATKFLLNDAAVKFGKPLVYGSISQFEGRAAVFWASRGPCYRCLHPAPPKAAIQNCAEAGVIGAVAGIIGSIQALETLKLAAGLQPELGRLMIFDCLSLSSMTLQVRKNPQCPVCSLKPEQVALESSEAENACALDHDSIRHVSAAELLASPSGTDLFIDVRETDEWRSGHISGAVHIPLSRLSRGQISEDLAPAPNQRLIVYCHAGVRSLTAIQLLSRLGFKNLWNLDGGLIRWRGPLVR